jgi:hypothetical protein
MPPCAGPRPGDRRAAVVGAVGLMGALDRFVPPPGATDLVGAFLAFAVPTVTGEIRRHFRDRTWSMRVPRRMKDLQGPVRKAVAELSRDLHRGALGLFGLALSSRRRHAGTMGRCAGRSWSSTTTRLSGASSCAS